MTRRGVAALAALVLAGCSTTEGTMAVTPIPLPPPATSIPGGPKVFDPPPPGSFRLSNFIEAGCQARSGTLREAAERARGGGVVWFTGNFALTGRTVLVGDPDPKHPSDWSVYAEARVRIDRVVLGALPEHEITAFIRGGVVDDVASGVGMAFSSVWPTDGSVFGWLSHSDEPSGWSVRTVPLDGDSILWVPIGCDPPSDILVESTRDVTYRRLTHGFVQEETAPVDVVSLTWLVDAIR